MRTSCLTAWDSLRRPPMSLETCLMIESSTSFSRTSLWRTYQSLDRTIRWVMVKCQLKASPRTSRWQIPMNPSALAAMILLHRWKWLVCSRAPTSWALGPASSPINSTYLARTLSTAPMPHRTWSMQMPTSTTSINRCSSRSLETGAFGSEYCPDASLAKSPQFWLKNKRPKSK